MKFNKLAILALTGLVASFSAQADYATTVKYTKPMKSAVACDSFMKNEVLKYVAQSMNRGELYEYEEYAGRDGNNYYFALATYGNDVHMFATCNDKNVGVVGAMRAPLSVVTRDPEWTIKTVLGKATPSKPTKTSSVKSDAPVSAYPNDMKLWKSCNLLPEALITVSEYKGYYVLQSWKDARTLNFETRTSIDDAFRGVVTFDHGDEMYAVDGNEIRVIKDGDIKVYNCDTY